jgi:hypothetical protein
MASINDVYNQLVAANTSLSQLHGDVVAETNATDQVKASVDQLDADLSAGFAQTEGDLAAIAAIETEAVKLIFHLSQQADAMICALEKISKNTCELLTQSTIQTRLQTTMREDFDAVRGIAEFANPAAVLERDRLAELRAEVERCCPPEEPEPACRYEPCPHPRPIKEPHLPSVAKGHQTEAPPQ